ncbi:MAG TPA: carboxypeptidase regulatory-like domain-containing protein [Sulfurovum sp.]|nr:MAG: hypothetical protein B7Y63_03575 [Sulfurovum sp. 35-42-20]OYY57577.1 MAG: hypothetical protein B7Y52_00640 [Sulfurovum sp. 28-43-6]OYZ24786.1 MAG: hypothetical protein B7Y23_08470 [Sulfurovum sp. 16-42-52]OZA44475.1 MAG: hypothetical protein B7X80_07705 [Sulfurovum sp. 17-42-90]OZA59651.1 MAG: hypothetical protein B7X69_07280 [Sulfurovum sp. 39-42-12]HQR73711.1 carboxypeptidase regulatory-like domain-containing protein [Sulfurovum sp.]
MLKIQIILWVSFLGIALFTGCGQNEAYLPHSNDPSNRWDTQKSRDDVDVSDLDETLTESEMMMSEERASNKVKRMAFPASEYANLQKLGKGTIKGSIYLKDPYGRQISGSGTRLYLNPVTSYSTQWYEESYLEGNTMQQADSRLFNYLKFTASDSSGRYGFYGVPSGSYYLIGTVKCGQECGFSGTKNVRIAKKVTISGNQILDADLFKTLE